MCHTSLNRPDINMSAGISTPKRSMWLIWPELNEEYQAAVLVAPLRTSSADERSASLTFKTTLSVEDISILTRASNSERRLGFI